MDDYLTRHETENLIGKVAGTIFIALTDGQPTEVIERAKASLIRAARDPEIHPACRRIYAIIADDNQVQVDLGIAEVPPRRMFEVIDGGGGPSCVWAQFDDDGSSAA